MPFRLRRSGRCSTPPRSTCCLAAGGQLELIGQSPNGTCVDGWQYSEDQSQIHLCGSTCERVRSSEGTLRLQFGCRTQVR
jgi:hypothetical protein